METEQGTTQDPSKTHAPPNTETSNASSRLKGDINANIGKISRSRWGGGRPAQFLEDRLRIHFGVRTTKERAGHSYVQKVVVDHDFVTAPPQHSVTTNTNRAEFKTLSILHTEGGWPKEINPRDVELVDRTKKKMQKEETYLETVPLMAKEAEYLVRHNNTLRLCDSSSKKSYVRKRDSKPFANVVSVYKCPSRRKRPISKITFAPDNAGRMAVAYCPYEFDPLMREHSCEAFFWEVENPTRPEGMVRASAQIVDLRYHQKDIHSICGALFTGQVASWDNRVGPNPQSVSTYEVSHEDVCTSAMWINSKTGYEFFSCGLDGMVIWWDVRNLSERLDTCYADPEKGRSEADQAIPITVLEYEHSLPTKFLVGTQFGQVMVFMKKGKTPQDRLVNLYEAHKGPVRSIHRNPVFIKNFMSCGDYHLRIFAEDCRDSGIMWTAPSDALYTYAQWLTGKPCGLVASRSDGCLEFWDLLMQGVSSILTTKVSEEALSTVWPADTGRHVAAGTVHGDIRMVKVCPLLHTFVKSDKSALAACFDRESRREKYLEQRNREIRLAKKHRDAKKKEQDDSEISGTVSENSSLKSETPENENLVMDKNFFISLAELEKEKQGSKVSEKQETVDSEETQIGKEDFVKD